jgi:hypothetical protein
MAERLRTEGAPIGEVFTYLSALYFRGKLTYARTFARPPEGAAGVLVITPSAGLLPHDTAIRLPQLRGFSRVPIQLKSQGYRSSLRRAAKKLAGEIGTDCEVVLLGSIATGKYLDILLPVLGPRLRVPAEFAGIGDMSRGGLLLRCVRARQELTYVPVLGAARHGPRPPKLPPIRGILTNAAEVFGSSDRAGRSPAGKTRWR